MNLNLQNKKKLKLYSSGFTLLEMIVSIGIFSVVAVIAVGSLVKITGLNRQAQHLQLAMDNINFILESISREMRFGTGYYCFAGNTYNGQPITTGLECNNDPGSVTKAILFNSTKPVFNGSGQFQCYLIQAYWFVPLGGALGLWDIRKSQQDNCNAALPHTQAVSLIDTNNVKVTNAEFTISDGNLNYSWATIRLRGYAGTKANEMSNFDIRTSISQRTSDI